MTVQDMVAWALAQQGKRYSEAPGLRCGPNSYDCSGLVYKACINGNIRPPGGTLAGCTATYAQWADRNSNGNTFQTPGPYPLGCLIYFDNGDGGPQPGHVGISLGDGTMINALNSQYGVLVCPQSYGGTPMGGIVLPGTEGAAVLTGDFFGNITNGIRTAIGTVIEGPVAATAVLGNLGKLATKVNNPTFMKRVGKGALAGLVGLVGLFVLERGMSSE